MGKCAPVFGQYGLYLTKAHPLAFARHYMLVNTKNYFLPPLEKLEVYNLGLDEYWPMAQYWFDMQKEAKSYLPKTFPRYPAVPLPRALYDPEYLFRRSIYLAAHQTRLSECRKRSDKDNFSHQQLPVAEFRF